MTAFTGNDYEITNNGGGFGAAVMVRKDNTGALYEEERGAEEGLAYDVIPEDMYDLEITAFQKRFELPRPARYMQPGMEPMVSKTRLEFTVLSGPQKGKRFLDLYTWSVGEKAALGKLLVAITQAPIPARWAMPQVLGLRFKAYVRYGKDQNGVVKTGKDGNPFPGVAIDTVKPLGAANAPAKPQPKSAPVDDRDTDPTLTWSAFWKFAKSYGFNPQNGMGAIETELGEAEGSFDGMQPGAVYALLAAHVGHEG